MQKNGMLLKNKVLIQEKEKRKILNKKKSNGFSVRFYHIKLMKFKGDGLPFSIGAFNLFTNTFCITPNTVVSDIH